MNTDRGAYNFIDAWFILEVRKSHWKSLAGRWFVQSFGFIWVSIFIFFTGKRDKLVKSTLNNYFLGWVGQNNFEKRHIFLYLFKCKYFFLFHTYKKRHLEEYTLFVLRRMQMIIELLVCDPWNQQSDQEAVCRLRSSLYWLTMAS